MFDAIAANKALEFINQLRHTTGKWRGQTFDLRTWQDIIISLFFGTMIQASTPTTRGVRQYQTCYVEIPRKNGKTELAAGVALKLLCADGEQGAEIYSCAGDIDQARRCFNAAVSMINQDEDLSSRCKVVQSQKTIIYPPTDSIYRAVSSDAYTKHGLNAHGIIFDELHVQPNRELWDVMTTSIGSREQPATFAITTAGVDRKSICWEIHDYARQVANGIIDDPTFLPFIYSAYETEEEQASEPDAWMDESRWFAANPALGDFRSLEEMRTLFKRCQHTPALIPTFQRLYLNMWVSAYSRAIDINRWNACSGPLPDLRGRVAYGALDLSSTEDLTAFILLIPYDDRFVVIPRFFCPEENILVRSRRDRVPYDQWARDGYLIATPGNVIDYDAILRHVTNARDDYDLRGIAFDRWGATRIVQELEKRNIEVINHGQGYASMNAPTKELLTLVSSGGLLHDGNPVLTWQADNLVTIADDAGNLKPSKSKSSEKIDGIVGLIMAITMLSSEPEKKESVYKTRGILGVKFG